MERRRYPTLATWAREYGARSQSLESTEALTTSLGTTEATPPHAIDTPVPANVLTLTPERRPRAA